MSRSLTNWTFIPWVCAIFATGFVSCCGVGVVMWEMVTREYPPEPLGSSRSSSVQTTLKTTRIEIVPCSLLSRHSFKQASDQRCPPSLTALIEDCLNFEPKLRPTTKDVKRRLLEMQANV